METITDLDGKNYRQFYSKEALTFLDNSKTN